MKPPASTGAADGNVAQWIELPAHNRLASSSSLGIPTSGRVAERLNAAVLKTVDVKASVGSNPTPSARLKSE